MANVLIESKTIVFETRKMLIYLFIVPFIMFTKNAKIFKKEDKIVYKRKINYKYLLGKKNY